jgi:hypothetical protein
MGTMSNAVLGMIFWLLGLANAVLSGDGAPTREA